MADVAQSLGRSNTVPPQAATRASLIVSPDLSGLGAILNNSANTKALTQLQLALNQRPSGPPIQRAKLNIRKDGTISGVSSFAKRPPSNLYGKQGQHLTAFVSFKDMIQSHVRDKTVPDAADALIALLDDFLTLPGMTAPKSPGQYVVPLQQQLVIARDNDDAKAVGAIIDDILRLRNIVPDTAVQGIGGGHGEAGHSGILGEVETGLRTGNTGAWNQNIVANQALEAMWRLFDYQPATGFNAGQAETIAKRVRVHMLSMRMAYPATFAWLSSDVNWHMLPYIRAHRTDAGMPLSALSNVEIDQIRDDVYALWA